MKPAILLLLLLLLQLPVLHLYTYLQVVDVLLGGPVNDGFTLE